MLTAPRKKLSHEDYLALEQTSDIKHEFFQGEVFAMSGGTFNHARIQGNTLVALSLCLRGKSCTPLGSDMRIRTPGGLDTYPDVSVFCGQPELADNQRTLLNPVMIVEVLSPSTRNYDKGGKFTFYREIACLQDYLLIDADKVFVEHFRRTGNGEWILHEYKELSAKVPLLSSGENLMLAEVYAQVAFTA